MKKLLSRTIIFLVLVAIALGAYKFRYLLDFSKTTLAPIQNEPQIQTVYNTYKVKIHKTKGDIYYLKLTNVVCDAAKDRAGEPHYFNFSLAFETADKKTAELLEYNEFSLVIVLRNTTKNFLLTPRNASDIMHHVKGRLLKEAQEIAGFNNVYGVYFEQFLSQ